MQATHSEDRSWIDLKNDLIKLYNIIQKSPGILLSNYIANTIDSSPYLKLSKFYHIYDINDFNQWHFISKFNSSKPVKIIDNRVQAINDISLYDMLYSQKSLASRVMQLFTRDIITAHNGRELSSNLNNGYLELLKDKFKLYFDPEFVIEGHPLKHMRILNQIDLLSTYDFQGRGIVRFKRYDFDTSCEEPIFIRSAKYIEAGSDPDKDNVIRCFTPRYAKLVYVSVSSGNSKLKYNEDYYVEYEEEGGHYRIVLLNEFPKNSIKYKIGYDPDKTLKEEVIGDLIIAKDKFPKISKFVDKLNKLGYTVLAEALNKLLEEREFIYASDLQKTLQKNIIYSLNSTNADRDIPYNYYRIKEDDTYMLSYLPNASEKGKGSFRCYHAGYIYADILNYLELNDAKFYGSTVLNTFYLGTGIVFAGLYHSTTQGVVSGAKFEQDSTPNKSLESYVNLLKNNLPKNLPFSKINKYIINFITNLLRKHSVQKNEVDVYTKIENTLNNYKQGVVNLIPKDKKTNKPLMGYRIPRPVKEIGSLLNGFKENYFEIIEDKSGKTLNLYIEQLNSIKKTWNLINTIERKDKGKLKKLNELFGDFLVHSDLFINHINSIENLLNSAQKNNLL